MYESGICDTQPTLSLKRSNLEPKLLQSVYRNSCTAYRLATNLVTWREPWRIFPGANIFTTDILHTFLLERDRINLFCSLFLDGKFQTSRCTASKQQRVAQHACLHLQQLILQVYTWFTNFIGACGNIVCRNYFAASRNAKYLILFISMEMRAHKPQRSRSYV